MINCDLHPLSAPEDFIVQSSYLLCVEDEISRLPGFEKALNKFGQAVPFGDARIYYRTTTLEPLSRDDSRFEELVPATLYQVAGIKSFLHLDTFRGYESQNREGSDFIAKTVRLAEPDCDARIYLDNRNS